MFESWENLAELNKGQVLVIGPEQRALGGLGEETPGLAAECAGGDAGLRLLRLHVLGRVDVHRHGLVIGLADADEPVRTLEHLVAETDDDELRGQRPFLKIHQSVNQYINRWKINKSIDQSMDESQNQSINQWNVDEWAAHIDK